jgi:hypothetical protein
MKEHLREGFDAFQQGTPVNGVKGPSIFRILPYYNYLHGGGEAMHTLFVSMF